VRPQSEQLRNALERASGVEDYLATEPRLQEGLEVVEREGEPLNADEVERIETGGSRLCSEFTRTMGVARERSFAQGRKPAGPFHLA
jgi:hypothetical protein